MTTQNQLLREALESYEHMIANGHKEHDALHAFDAVDIPNLVRAAIAAQAKEDIE